MSTVSVPLMPMHIPSLWNANDDSSSFLPPQFPRRHIFSQLIRSFAIVEVVESWFLAKKTHLCYVNITPGKCKQKSMGPCQNQQKNMQGNKPQRLQNRGPLASSFQLLCRVITTTANKDAYPVKCDPRIIICRKAYLRLLPVGWEARNPSERESQIDITNMSGRMKRSKRGNRIMKKK